MEPPHNMTMTVTGTAMLWVGWFGFNAGSALAANGDAAMALLVTHLSASTATLVWMGIEWVKLGKPSVRLSVPDSDVRKKQQRRRRESS